MSWYAHQVFATPKPSVMAAIASLPGLEGAAYHIPHLNDMSTVRKVVDGVILGEECSTDLLRTVTTGPGMPADGLIVIRELCDTQEEEGAAEWFGCDGRCWSGLEAVSEEVKTVRADYEFLFEGAPEWWTAVAPPPSVLAVFQEIAVSTETPVSYFCHHMWGGDTECAFAWVWDGERDESVFYRAVLARNTDGIETTAFYTDTTGALAVRGDHRRLIVDGDVLTLVLLHHGLMLRDGHFELHTRRFPWDRYRV